MGNTTSFAFVSMAIDLANENLLPDISPLLPATITAISKACKLELPWQYAKNATFIARLLANVQLSVYPTDPWNKNYVQRPFNATERNNQLSILSKRLARHANRYPNKYSVSKATDIYRELFNFTMALKAEKYDLFVER